MASAGGSSKCLPRASGVIELVASKNCSRKEPAFKLRRSFEFAMQWSKPIVPQALPMVCFI